MWIERLRPLLIHVTDPLLSESGAHICGYILSRASRVGAPSRAL